ncbi:MAG: Cof-type HAD-IIB family hydrolase [Chloroflexi bacterium]|nr:Cof-type HAD-IIB family hydrolase [Chloroflexota bacterium]
MTSRVVKQRLVQCVKGETGEDIVNAPIRLIATDLDGTLLRSDGTVSERTRQAITHAREAGIAVVLVTARPPRILRLLAREVGVAGLAICCNGAIVYDLSTEAIVAHMPLASVVAQRLVAALRVAVPDVCFAVERGVQAGHDPRYAALRPIVDDHPSLIADALTLCAEDVTKLLVHHPAMPLPDLLRTTREIAGDAAVVTHSSTLFVEVSAAGVTKATALERLCAQLDIDTAQVVACGDMPNDLPMLHWAGHSVAVANAHPDVLAAVAEVTLSNDEDGVARMLERETAMVVAARQRGATEEGSP